LVRRIELQRLETFPGAACCQAIELPPFKAAPLQALGFVITVGRKIILRGGLISIKDEDDYDETEKASVRSPFWEEGLGGRRVAGGDPSREAQPKSRIDRRYPW
jgi:hypothetical protein